MMSRPFLLLAAAVLSSLTGFAATRSEVADAVMSGNNATLRALLQRRAGVNIPQIDGATALHWAVYRNDQSLAGSWPGSQPRQ